jgi:hypothetical protein
VYWYFNRWEQDKVTEDGGFAGRLLNRAQSILATTLHIVRKPADQRGFAVIPRRWAVERSFAWLSAHRRLARDYERDPAISEAMIRWVAINTITRGIARGGPAIRQQRREFTIQVGKDGVAVVAVCSTINFGLRTPAEQESLVASFGRYLHSLTAPVQVLI